MLRRVRTRSITWDVPPIIVEPQVGTFGLDHHLGGLPAKITVQETSGTFSVGSDWRHDAAGGMRSTSWVDLFGNA
jgi:hypothetical protein